MIKFLMFLIGSLVLLSCNKAATSPNDPLTLSTDKDSYSVNETISFTLNNNSMLKIYISHCNFRFGFYVEQKTNETWSEKSSVAMICPAIYTSGMMGIESGKSHRDTLTIMQAGTYRIKYPFGWQETGASIDFLFSNPFTVQ